MKRGDIVTIFGNPLGLKQPEGLARLVNPIQIGRSIEIWEVEFVDDEGWLFTKLIRNENSNNSNLIFEYERLTQERD